MIENYNALSRMKEDDEDKENIEYYRIVIYDIAEKMEQMEKEIGRLKERIRDMIKNDNKK